MDDDLDDNDGLQCSDGGYDDVRAHCRRIALSQNVSPLD